MKRISIRYLAHPVGVPCPICTDPTLPFAAVHYSGPPCLRCRYESSETIGTRAWIRYRCPACGHTWKPDSGL